MSPSRSCVSTSWVSAARARIVRVARAHVKLVEKDPDDAAAARLQAHGFDRARFAGVGQLEIAGLQILDGPRLGVGHHDIEGDRFVCRRRSLECAELWRDYGQAVRQLRATRRDRDAESSHLEMTVMLPAVPVCCTRSKSTTALR